MSLAHAKTRKLLTLALLLLGAIVLSSVFSDLSLASAVETGDFSVQDGVNLSFGALGFFAVLGVFIFPFALLVFIILMFAISDQEKKRKIKKAFFCIHRPNSSFIYRCTSWLCHIQQSHISL